MSYLSLLGFDCCSLTLQPCENPVVTKEGWLYDKEAILKYMIEKKQEYARKLKEYERQKNEDLKDLHELAKAEKAAEVKKFEMAEKNIARYIFFHMYNRMKFHDNEILLHNIWKTAMQN